MRSKRSVSDMPVGPLPMEDMFKMATRSTSTWGIDGYEIPRSYLDPQKQAQEREQAKIKKGQKDKRHVTKRGHYLDDLAKITKQVPGPCKYEVSLQWVDPKDKQRKLTSAPHKRQTFIDEIFREQKLRGVPGTGKYNLEKPLEEIKKEVEELKKRKVKDADRPSFLNDYQYHASLLPGPGQYNPRELPSKEKLNLTKPETWIQKHKEESRKRGKSVGPDIGSYKSHPLDYDTFGKMLQNKEEKRQIIERKIWGLEERFKDPKKTKIQLKTFIPGPGQYPLIVEWQGKDAKKEKKRTFIDVISKGPVKSIYY